MRSQFRVPTATIASIGSVPDSAGRRIDPVLESIAAGRIQPVQVDWSPHVVALIGIVALALLGGVLVARNRLADQSTIGTVSTPDSEEFVTDRERIQRLVRENGGRMKQSKIVDSVDWSKAKVSRLLAELEEDGQITKLRLGRENLVCLPGHEPTASQSPEQPKNE